MHCICNISSGGLGFPRTVVRNDFIGEHGPPYILIYLMYILLVLDCTTNAINKLKYDILSFFFFLMAKKLFSDEL
uniref:Uncharacterized protein MANES_03G190100 n=1 Tax=Rhizophora mucronata TaxID=61149 RepID=A0A2P2JWT0_RHIMU